MPSSCPRVSASSVAPTQRSQDILVAAPCAAHRSAPSPKSLGAAVEIRRRVLTAVEQAEGIDDPVEERRLLEFVVIGGGPTRVEFAGALGNAVRPPRSLGPGRRASTTATSIRGSTGDPPEGARTRVAKRSAGRGSRGVESPSAVTYRWVRDNRAT